MNDAPATRKQRLTVFLIKSGFTKIEEFLSLNELNILPITADGTLVGTLAYRGGVPIKPSWVEIFTGVPGFDPSNLRNQGTKALYTLLHEGRWFCFTFGHARSLINDLAIERNFGLRVTLNLGDPAAIKSIDKANISHVSLHSKEQATREIELAGFEFNNDIDLLKSVTAKTPIEGTDEHETISGKDSVSLYKEITVETFSDIAKRLFQAYQSQAYKKLYPWIDKIIEERDKTVIDALDSQLSEKINGLNFQGVWLAVPELIEWEKLDGFVYTTKGLHGGKNGPVTHRDLSIDVWLCEAKLAGKVTVIILKARKIHALWLDSSTTSWSAYRCLNAELDHNGKMYILNDGDWYNIDSDYVAEINAFYAGVQDANLVLPPFGSMKEPEYLKHVASNDVDFALMDRKLVKIGGNRSSVEFCDLYSKSKSLIMHVKYYGGSSLLSHLFNQALVSGECFLYEHEFRVQVHDYLPDAFKFDALLMPVSANDFEVCVAIMSKHPGPLEIPFFSKVSLKQVVRSLRQFGYKVSKLKIEQV